MKEQAKKFGELWAQTDGDAREAYKKKEEEGKAAYQEALKSYKEANPEYVPTRRRHKKRTPKETQKPIEESAESEEEAPEKSLLDE